MWNATQTSFRVRLTSCVASIKMLNTQAVDVFRNENSKNRWPSQFLAVKKHELKNELHGVFRIDEKMTIFRFISFPVYSLWCLFKLWYSFWENNSTNNQIAYGQWKGTWKNSHANWRNICWLRWRMGCATSEHSITKIVEPKKKKDGSFDVAEIVGFYFLSKNTLADRNTVSYIHVQSIYASV